MIKIDNILMATDFTRFSREGRLLARDLCRRFGATLHFLHVVDDRAHSLADVAEHLMEPNDVSAARHAAEKERAVVKLWSELFPDYHKDHEVEFAVVSGQPTEEIVSYAREHQIDLIVTGTHGRTGIDRFLSGSIAEHLVQLAPCPVLTVHSDHSPKTLDVAVDIRIKSGRSKTERTESTQ